MGGHRVTREDEFRQAVRRRFRVAARLNEPASTAEIASLWLIVIAAIITAVAAARSYRAVAMGGAAAIGLVLVRSAILRSVLPAVILLSLALLLGNSGYTGWTLLCALGATAYALFGAAWVQSRQVEGRALDAQDSRCFAHADDLDQLAASRAPFVLYLRGFESEAPQAELEWTEAGVMVVGHKHDRDPQLVVRDALPDGVPVFAVANQRSLDPSPVFPEVIVPDDDGWLDIVRHYARHAAIVVVWYERASDGVEAECDLLAAEPGLRAKTWLTFNPYVQERGSAFERLRAAARWVSEWNRGRILPRPVFPDVTGSAPARTSEFSPLGGCETEEPRG